MQVQYSAETLDLDKAVEEAQAERPDKPIRVRLQPALLRSDGAYVAWRGVAWSVACETPAEAIALRQALVAFFAAIGTHGIAAVTDILTPEPTTT